MRNKSFLVPLLLVVAMANLQSCKKDEMLNNAAAPDAAFSMAGNVPRYSMVEFNALLANTTDEEALYKKVEMLTFAITDFLGSRTTIDNNGTLAGTFPCDLNIFGLGGEVMRMMGDASGLTEVQVRSELNARIMCLVTDCGAQPIETQNQMLNLLLSSLRMEDEQFMLIAKRPETIVNNSNNEFFVGYGIYSNQSGQDLAAGFRYQLNSDVVSLNRSLPLNNAAGRNMLLLDIVATGSGSGIERELDPCFWMYTGGSGGSGGSGSGGGGSGGGVDLDDDGLPRNKTLGPIVVPAPGTSGCPGVPDAVRIAEFHLADRNEGGLFSGKSEVYFHVIIYKSTDPIGTKLHNNGLKPDATCVNLTAGSVDSISTGKWLYDASNAQIDNTSNIKIIPSTEDGKVVDYGFCSDPIFGYDRLLISFYERDKTKWLWSTTQLADLPVPPLDICETQLCRAQFNSDIWFSNLPFRIRYEDFATHGNVMYIYETAGGYGRQYTEPSANVSWFKLVLY